jgi:hypothetical protein
MHFQTWHDKAGNATPLTDVDPVTGATVTFQDLTTGQPESLQANPDHAGADPIPQQKIPDLLHYSPDQYKRGRNGGGQGAHG